MYVTKPSVGRGSLLLRFLKQHEVFKPPDSAYEVDEPKRASSLYSPPHFDREFIGESSDDDKYRFDSWEHLRVLDDADTVCFSDIEPDSPAVAVVSNDDANATVPRAVPREPVRDVVLRSVAVDAIGRNGSGVQSVPIAISDDLVDIGYVQEVLDAPEDDWPIFDDIFGLSDVNEGEETLEPRADASIPILVADDVTQELEKRDKPSK